MNFEYYIFEKVGKVYTQEPNESFVAEVISKSEKLSVGKDCFVTHRDGSLLYYIVFIHGAKKEYRGICIALNGVYALSPIDLLKKIRQKRDKTSPLIREELSEVIDGFEWCGLPAFDLSLPQDKMREFQSCGGLGILEATSQYPYVLIYCDEAVKEQDDIVEVEKREKSVDDLEEIAVAEQEQENVKEEQIVVADKDFEKTIANENPLEWDNTQEVEEEPEYVTQKPEIENDDDAGTVPKSHGGISISIILSTLIALGIITYKKVIYEERYKKALIEHTEKEKMKHKELINHLGDISQDCDLGNKQNILEQNRANELSKFKKDANEYIKRDVKNMDVKALDSLLNVSEEFMKKNSEDKELERIKGKLETHKAQRIAYEAKLKLIDGYEKDN